MKTVIFDLDDYCPEHYVLPSLDYLKTKLPGLKVNLFTIPAKMTRRMLEKTAEREWIQMIPHGWKHDDNFECASLSYRAGKRLLKKINTEYYVKGFKSPGWQISKGMMEALREYGWWVAVQWSDGRFFGHADGPFQPAVPKGLRYYALNERPEFNCIHGHCQNVCANGLEQLWQNLIALPVETNFKFIDDIV